MPSEPGESGERWAHGAGSSLHSADTAQGSGGSLRLLAGVPGFNLAEPAASAQGGRVSWNAVEGGKAVVFGRRRRRSILAQACSGVPVCGYPPINHFETLCRATRRGAVCREIHPIVAAQQTFDGIRHEHADPLQASRGWRRLSIIRQGPFRRPSDQHLPGAAPTRAVTGRRAGLRTNRPSCRDRAHQFWEYREAPLTIIAVGMILPRTSAAGLFSACSPESVLRERRWDVEQVRRRTYKQQGQREVRSTMTMGCDHAISVNTAGHSKQG